MASHASTPRLRAQRLWSFALACALALPATAAEPLKYLALVDNGKQAGHLTVAEGEGGKVLVDFIFKDNGRGPELKEEYTLAPDGTFLTYSVKGSSTFGAQVEESFRIENGTAYWTSKSDVGEQPHVPGAAYSPLAGTPQSFSVAMSALAKRGDGKLPLIPSGALSMRKVDEAQVIRGAETRKVDLLMFSGVGFTPIFVWATGSEQPRLFASIFPGSLQLIEEGWQGNAGMLEQRQKQAERNALVDRQKRLARPLAGTTLIRNARIFDSRAASLGPASDVLIRDGRILAISDAGVASPTANRVIDAGGRIMLPGLFDMHGHIGEWDGGLNLAAGVTTVRDMGNDNATLQQLMSAERAGRIMSPNVVAAGFIEGESPMSARNGFVISTLEEAKKAVDWYAERKYVGVKIYNSFPKDILAQTVAYAHSRDLRVSGHVPVYLRAQDAVDAGYDEIQHINQVLLNFLVDDTTDTRTLERFYLPAKRVADLNFDSPPVQAFIARLSREQVAVDPTLTAFDFMRHRDGQLSPAYASIAEHLPPDVRRGLLSGQFDIPDDATAALYERSYQKMVDFVGRMYRAGVPILAGTDGIPGFTLQRELELYVQAGMTPAQALQVATWNGAKYSRLMDDRGSIEVGKRADLILVDGDPTANISDIRKVALTIKSGTAYLPAEILDGMGIKPFTPALSLGAAR